MSKSNISKHWAGRGYNLESESPLKGAYSSGADASVYVSDAPYFRDLQNKIVEGVQSQNKIEQAKKVKPSTLEEDLRSGKISNAAYNTLTDLKQGKNKTTKEVDFSNAVSFDNLKGTMPGYENIGKKSYKTPGYEPFKGASLMDKNFKSPLGIKAIEKNMKKNR
jgi:hypothetical protein